MVNDLDAVVVGLVMRGSDHNSSLTLEAGANTNDQTDTETNTVEVFGACAETSSSVGKIYVCDVGICIL